MIKTCASIAIVATLFVALFPRPGAAGERMSPELLWKLGRVGGGSLSKDGERLAYTVGNYSLEENKGTKDIHVLEIAKRRDRVVAKSLPSAGGLQWVSTPAGERLFYVGKGEEEKAKPQVWSLDPRNGEKLQVTNEENGVGNLKVSPTGTHIAFTTDVKMDETVNDLYPDLPKADARIIDSLMYRHWNAWHDFSYSHIHTAPLLESGKAGETTDLMTGMKVDCPVPPFGGADDYTWSPDGKHIVYTAKLSNDWAQSTDSDLYLVSSDGKGRTLGLTPGMNGYDNHPVFSPDGKFLAFHSMERPGFEADRNRIMILDRSSGQIREATAGLDQTSHSATWTPDSSGLFFMSECRGTNQIFSISAHGGAPVQVTRGRSNYSIKAISKNGQKLYLGYQSMLRPWEIGEWDLEKGELKPLTQVNDHTYSKLDLPTITERWVKASDGEMIHNWVIYPPNYNPEQKWPMLTYCQGGPQGQIGQWFSFRWNFHLMASQGYVVLAVNRRGLPGFGRKWNDDISKDWGGQAMQDILAATDDMLTDPSIDPKRVGAIGASFGGYTAYWLMGNHRDRFCTMISHCGVFNLESMYGSTEELFFVNWDLGGPYWKNPSVQADYDRFSPHRFVGNWKTPLLVIHGEKDFRVPVTQGMEAFTAAQVRGIPSRFLYFPNEGHWVLSPQNGVLWHRVFFDWLNRFCRPRVSADLAQPAY